MRKSVQKICAVQATREVRVCSEARQHLSQQLSSTKSEVRNLQQSIKELESKLKDQQHVCREASENQGKCSKNLEELNAQLQAAQEELGGSNTRISELMVDLEDARRLKSQLQDARKQCEGMAQQEREKQEQRIFDLQQQLQSSEAARQQSESDISSSVLAVREEAAKLRTELDQERTKFEAASSRIQAEHGAKIQMMQQQLEAAEADHTSAKSDAETLTVELQSCQVSLSQELQVRRQDEAQAALQESLHSKVISEFKQQEQELVKDSHEMQVCIVAIILAVMDVGHPSKVFWPACHQEFRNHDIPNIVYSLQSLLEHANRSCCTDWIPGMVHRRRSIG